MTKKPKFERKIIPLLRTSTSALLEHRRILFPYILMFMLQIFYLEILYFSPRYPLVNFFGPIIRSFWGEQFLHYPQNLLLLPRLFHNIFVQGFFYIFINSFLIAVSIGMILSINEGSKIRLKDMCAIVWERFVHIFVLAVLSFVCVKYLLSVYSSLYERALIIRSVSGKFYMLKTLIINGSPYFNLLISVIIAMFFAYALPIIISQKKNVFSAIKDNFFMVCRAPVTTFMIILLPSLLYVPILLLRSSFVMQFGIPELSVLMLIFSAFVMVLIDAIVYTSLTTFYLLQKDWE